MARKKIEKTESGVPKVRKYTGTTRGKRKLSDEQVLDIVKRYASGAGERMSVLAREFNVTHPTISSIVRGLHYRWLTGLGQAA